MRLNRGVLSRPLAIYLFFCISFICLMDVASFLIPHMMRYWLLSLFFGLGSIAIIFGRDLYHRRDSSPFYLWLCVAYFLLIVIVSSQHLLALLAIPANVPIDAYGVSAGEAFKTAGVFSIFLMLFPLSLAVNHFLVKQIPLAWVIRTLIGTMAVSVAVLYYQVLVDFHFLCSRCDGGRVSGLATDLNAYPLMVPIAAGFALVGIRLERRWYAKASYMMFLFVLLVSVYFVGSRSLFGGIFVFACICPPLLAIVSRHWPIWRRWMVGASSIVFVGVGLLLLGYLHSLHGSQLPANRLLHKLEYSLSWFFKDGIAGVLYEGNPRGKLYEEAITLISRSPLGGWGPGAFYREWPNVVFQQYGTIPTHLLGSPHNHYLHMGVDLGLWGMAENLLLLLIPATLGVFLVFRSRTSDTRFVASILVSSALAVFFMLLFLPFSWFPDVTWFFSSLLVILLVLADKEGIGFNLGAKHNKTVGMAVGIGFVAAFFGGHQAAFGRDGYMARQSPAWWKSPYEQGCFPSFGVERKENGRWCGKDAKLLLRIKGRAPNELVAMIRVSHPDAKDDPVQVQFGLAGSKMQEIRVSDHAWHQVHIPIARDDITHLSGHPGYYVRLLLHVSRTWVPRAYNISDDLREYGVAIKLP